MCSTRPGRRILAVIIFNLLIVVLVFGGLEFAFRRRHSRLVGSWNQHPRALRDQWTAWRNSPYFRGTQGAQHDAQGFRRDQDVSVEKPPNTVRIFLVGGSAAYGDTGGYPEIDSNYSRLYNNQLIDYQLEKRLNAAFPTRHWEVINAATMEYRLHQQLALIESVLLRYHPDCIVFMDGYNDLVSLSTASSNYDAYSSTPHQNEFNLLANPGSAGSFLFFTTTWLKANSALFLSLSEHLQARTNKAQHKSLAERGEFANPVRLSDLSLEEQSQFATSRAQVSQYIHVVSQIHGILDLDGVRAVFLLQPILILTHKPLTDSERRMFSYNLRLDGPLLAYDFEQLYPQIATEMEAAAKSQGFSFLNLTDVFDQTSQQTFSDYCHLTSEGNRVIAERVFAFLQNSFAEKALAPN
jgi:lysophospholipase L1-like esterase